MRGECAAATTSAATIATVLSISRWKASIVTSRSASGVSSSLQWDRPLVDMANIITAGIARLISTASWSGPEGSQGRVPGDLLHGLGA